jgi:hypothetical protein
MLVLQCVFGLLGDAVADAPIYNYDEAPGPERGPVALISLLVFVIVVGGMVAYVFLGRRSDKKRRIEREQVDSDQDEKGR